MDLPDSASRVFCGRILSMVNTDDVNAIILAQKNMLDRFEKTNEMLLNFNNLSSARLQQMSERFLHHTRTLVEMKRDLDSIFRRIRTLKGKLARQHPEAFSQQSTGSCDTSPDIVLPSLSPSFEDLSHGQLLPTVTHGVGTVSIPVSWRGKQRPRGAGLEFTSVWLESSRVLWGTTPCCHHLKGLCRLSRSSPHLLKRPTALHPRASNSSLQSREPG
nr:kxDL motif-containing protein 1 isoform X1 [Pongo pygmaeus]XP_054322313.1 kxDL motif-containing protein 1 isoform X1 [Pongo pygmaeus]